jgi:small nuclear ribonucleoprotein (snRNP)-like protein
MEYGAMMEPSKKPLNVLIKQLHGNIEVVLKNGCEYKGKMIKVDGHMNILLKAQLNVKKTRCSPIMATCLRGTTYYT